MKIKSIILWAVVAIVSAGCGGPDSILLKPDATKHIRTIAILKMKKPAYFMMDLSSATPWGAGMAAKDAQTIRPKFEAELKKENFDFEKYFTHKLHAYLKQQGYKTYNVNVKRDEKGLFYDNYAALKLKNIDAILDLNAIEAGYVLENLITSNFWRPSTRIFVRLVNTKDNATLYQNNYMYGHHNPFMSAIDIDAPKKFHFEEREDIFKAGSKTIVAGLKDGADKVAKQIALQLKK